MLQKSYSFVMYWAGINKRSVSNQVIRCLYLIKPHTDMETFIGPEFVLRGTRCLGSGELVYEKRLKLFVIKCILFERCLKSTLMIHTNMPRNRMIFTAGHFMMSKTSLHKMACRVCSRRIRKTVQFRGSTFKTSF